LALTVSHSVADRPTDRPPPALRRAICYIAVISDPSVRAPARAHTSTRARHFFPRRASTSYLPADTGAALKNEPGHYFCSSSPLPPPQLLHGLTGPVPLSSSLSPLPTSFPPAQLAMCRISECAKMKREKRSPRRVDDEDQG